jgi:hypothetical protein
MNIIEKIKSAGLQNGLEFNISCDKKTRVFYNESNPNLYKILSRAIGSKKDFDSMCAYLIQNKKDCQYVSYFNGYTASFIEGEFEVVIKKNINHYHYIAFYKLKNQTN